MIRTAEKNRKQRFSNLPINIGSILKIAFGFAFLLRTSVIQTSLMTLGLASVAVAGFALWGWSFVATCAGIYLAWAIIKGVLSCLVSLAVIACFILLLIVLIF